MLILHTSMEQPAIKTGSTMVKMRRETDFCQAVACSLALPIESNLLFLITTERYIPKESINV